MSDDVVDRHYRNLAKRYDEFLYYSDDFVPTLTRKMVAMLDLGPDDVFVDLGGGTGMYTIDILRQVPLEHGAILVDPFADMVARVPKDQPIECIVEDGFVWSTKPGRYDKILIKEMIHHIKDRKALIENLYARLNPGGVLLLVHIPPVIDYPLFEAALERAKTWHADPDDLVAYMEGAGFAVTRDAVDVTQRLPKEVYFDMVRTGYMSVLTSFPPEEREKGLEEMALTYADVETLVYNDHFDYLAGRKPG